MNKASIDPAHILDSYRKSDAVLIVRQHNARKALEIVAGNGEASRLLGVTAHELDGMAFASILPPRIQSALEEFVEFGDDNSNDLLSVLMKVRNFSLIQKGGAEKPFRLRVIRGEEEQGNPWFHLVLVDESLQQRTSDARNYVHEQCKANEIINDNTFLPNRGSVFKSVELVVEAVIAQQIRASFAVIDINQYDKIKNEQGAAAAHNLHRVIGMACKQKLRPEDVVGSLNERTLGLVLIDASQEEARMVLNRLRWTISVSSAENNGQEISSQVNIAFAEVDGQVPAATVFEGCEMAVGELKAAGQTNAIQLALTHERRKREERRKQNIPVAFERRKAVERRS